MKKSFMNNIKNFVDSNVRQRIDRVAHHNNEIQSDDLLLAERHFDDLRQVCVDAEKKISAMLQSIQSTSNPSHLGAYTQNVQAGLNNLSHNIGLQAANIAVSTSSNNSATTVATTCNSAKIPENHLRGQFSPIAGEPTKLSVQSYNVTDTQQYNSSESLSTVGNTCGSSNHRPASSQPSVDLNCHPHEELSNDVQQRHKKLPVVGYYKFLVKSSQRLKQDSLLSATLSQCSQIQIQLTNLYLSYEQFIEAHCLKPIQCMLETDIPNVVKLRKAYLKAHNDYEFLKTKYNGACLKQQQQQQNLQAGHFTSNTSYLISQNSVQQPNTNKLDQLKIELDEAITKSEQSKDTYETELYGFLCREIELANLQRTFYQSQVEYHMKVANVMQGLLPSLDDALALTPRKFAFGTRLDEHLRCTGRTISPVIELCVHFLHSQGLKEEGLFRIPGSSIKMKKLKNAINAWFVSLVSLEELGNDQGRQSGHSCVIALHDLFKNAVGHKGHEQLLQQSSTLTASNVLKSSLATDESAIDQTNFPASKPDDADEIILDVHSIAGLLKLYLRELPEPLFTHTLYDQWIECVSDKSATIDERIESLGKVIKQLPQTNYANLKHLIQFLQILSLNQEQNKMTATNLAIAMAPSLIWPKPNETTDHTNNSSSDDSQSLNMQISSFGVSASLHAMLLEALINNADALFLDSSDFTLPGFSNLTLSTGRNRLSKRSRSVKSTSPTGLSTTSSSSFSSNASNSTSSSAVRGHGRKGGSMEGLLSGQDISSAIHQQPPIHGSSPKSAGRPVSVQIQRDSYSSLVRGAHAIVEQNSKPPVPITRSHPPRQTSIDSSRLAQLNSSNKPPAPPVPPPTSIRHQQERLKAAAAAAVAVTANSMSPTPVENDKNPPTMTKPRPASLRGTGTISVASQNNVGSGPTTPTGAGSLNVARPTVPPPERPKTTSVVTDNGDDDDDGANNKCNTNVTVPPIRKPILEDEETSPDDTKSVVSQL